jgi:hypothetical protein
MSASGPGRCEVLGAGGDQVGGSDVEDVAQRGEHRQRQPFRCLGDQPPHLDRRQFDAPFGQQRGRVRGGEQAAGGYRLAQAATDRTPAGGWSPGCPVRQGRLDRGVQRLPQRAGAEVRGHARIDRSGRGVLMAGLLLHEQGIPARLDQVRDIGKQRSEWKSRPPVRPSAARYSANRLLIVLTVIRPSRSDGHNAGELAASGISGRASAVHCARMSAVHGHTASTERGFGRRALVRLAEPDPADPEPAELGRVRVRAEISDIEHRGLPAAQPEPVSDFEQRRIAERRQPPLTARRIRSTWSSA